MTVRQLAIAAGADLKWLTNSAALLRRRLRPNEREARWWGLVKVFVEEIGLSLKAAAAAASNALLPSASTPPVSALANASGSAAVVVDVPRYLSVFLGNLSRALVHEVPRRRGRRPVKRAGSIAAAQRYGVDIGLLRTALERTPAQRLALLERNAAFLRDMRRASK